MSEARGASTAQLEEQLDGVSRTLSKMERLNARQAERVAVRMDHIASQLLELSPPPAIAGGLSVARRDPGDRREFASLADQMELPDGEG